jgi:hypothetical protein
VSIIKSVPNLISYLHGISWNFSQLLDICFELFSSGSIFNSKNHCHASAPTRAPRHEGAVQTVSCPRPDRCPPRPDGPTASLASPRALPDSRVRSRRRFASIRVCPSAPRRHRLCRLRSGKCVAPPCLHAEPTALTSLPPPRSPLFRCRVFTLCRHLSIRAKHVAGHLPRR